MVFPQPGFSNIAGVTITASGMGPVSSAPSGYAPVTYILVQELTIKL